MSELKTPSYIRNQVDKYNDKRKNDGSRRLPSSFVDAKTGEQLDDLAAIYGSKSAAITVAIELLHGEQFKDKEN